MKNTIKSVLTIAAIALLLMMGTTTIPIQSYASEEHEKNGDNKASAGSDTEIYKKSTSQKMDQDNLCYGVEQCQQANKEQQLVGKDNEAKGFNDQSLDIQVTATTTTIQPPTQPQTPAQQQTQSPTPTTTATLNICKTVIRQPPGATFQPSDFTFTFLTPADPSTFQGANEGCTAVTVALGPYTFAEVVPQSVNRFVVLLYDDCEFGRFLLDRVFFTGFIREGETQTCTIKNAITE
jgi:hypothetical protein